MTLIFGLSDGLKLRVDADRRSILRPRVLTDGRMCVSSAALADASHEHLSATLVLGLEEVLTSSSFENPTVAARYMGKTYEIFADSKEWCISSPSADVLRFEVRSGDVGWSGDAVNNNNRSEVSAISRMSYGTAIWEAWSFLLESGDGIPYGHCMVGQWHGSDLPGFPRSPVNQLELGGDKFRITSRAGASTTANGVMTTHLAEELPLRNTWINFVRKTVFGLDGTLELWRNGTKIVNYAGPIGYYNDAQGPYLKFGIYRNRHENSVAVRYANYEWGTTDLTDRILNPLPVST